MRPAPIVSPRAPPAAGATGRAMLGCSAAAPIVTVVTSQTP